MNIKKWRNISVIFSLILGTLLHFTYKWSGQNIFIGAISSVNESTWEHLKLVFYPMLLSAVIGYFIFGKNVKNYLKGNAIGIIFAISFLTIFFYTYSGIIGENFTLLNIGSFIFSIILGEYIGYKIVEFGNENNTDIYLEIIVILLICFIIFTFLPPKINYFKDPITNTYGIQM